MIYALGWMIIQNASWCFPLLLLVTGPFAFAPILLPASRLLALWDPNDPTDSQQNRPVAAGHVISIWLATVALTATPRDREQILGVAFTIYLLAGLSSAWSVKVPLKKLPNPRILCLCGLASQSLWFVFGKNVIDNLNGLFG
jgi:hypothetical protein